MNLSNFISLYPDEVCCKQKLKEIRDQQGIVCPHCGCTEHYWKKDKECYECKNCSKRQSLKANTIMHGSQLPVRYWFISFRILIVNKNKISALELQHQLGHKYYQPIWAMLNKLRLFTKEEIGKYFLSKIIEPEEPFFFSTFNNEDKNESLKESNDISIINKPGNRKIDPINNKKTATSNNNCRKKQTQA